MAIKHESPPQLYTVENSFVLAAFFEGQTKAKPKFFLEFLTRRTFNDILCALQPVSQ